MQAVLSVVQAGPLVSVQDGGRFGRMRFGVPASGPMDRAALRIANTALGNPAEASGIEVSRGGLILECQAGEVGFAVAGGGFRVDLGGRQPGSGGAEAWGGGSWESGSWGMASLRAGDRLAIRPGHWGSWTCLAFAGQLQAPEWLGSRATHHLSGLGGGGLVAGGQVVIDAARAGGGAQAIPCPVWARPPAVVRVVTGPQDRCFAPEVCEAFLTRPFRLSDAYDRMGVRLSGPPLPPGVGLDLPSEAIVRGSVQVAGDGVATVLLADHQTTGGYPKIATVLDCDLDRFVQLRSRDPVRFHAVTPEAALLAYRVQHRAEARYLQALARRVRSA